MHVFVCSLKCIFQLLFTSYEQVQSNIVDMFIRQPSITFLVNCQQAVGTKTKETKYCLLVIQ